MKTKQSGTLYPGSCNDVIELIDAAYDTAHYAGDGRSGTELHQERIREREQLRDKLEARLSAADALAVAVPHLLKSLDDSKESMLYNQQEAADLVSAALRQYREAE